MRHPVGQAFQVKPCRARIDRVLQRAAAGRDGVAQGQTVDGRAQHAFRSEGRPGAHEDLQAGEARPGIALGKEPSGADGRGSRSGKACGRGGGNGRGAEESDGSERAEGDGAPHFAGSGAVCGRNVATTGGTLKYLSATAATNSGVNESAALK